MQLRKVWSKLQTKGVGRWLFLFFVFVLGLSVFIHVREVSLPNLELNSIASEYVLAQTGFEFPDIEATQLLKQEAGRDIGKVYRIDEKQIFQCEGEVEKFLVMNQEWRHKLPQATFENFYFEKEALRDSLLKSRFIDERTLQKIVDMKLPSENYIIFAPENTEYVKLPSPVWDCLNRSGSSLMAYLMKYLETQVWSFREDLSLQNGLRHAVKSNILLKNTKIEPGTCIINAGERVTRRHLDIMQAMKKALAEERSSLEPFKIIGSILMALFFTVLGMVYLRLQHKAIFYSFSKMALVSTIIILTLALAKSTEFFLINKAGYWIDRFHYLVFVPFGTILMATLLSRELAIIASGFLAMILAITLAVDYDHFLVMNLAAAMIAMIEIRTVRRRKAIFEVCAKIWIATIPIVIAFHLYDHTILDFGLIADLITTLLCMTLTAVIVVGLLPIFEAVFDIVTDMTLMEYADPNHALLRRLSVEAPGTYHHSLVVGALAEAAAASIGANSLFCRVATLYHDIGKLANPQYFTENQSSGFNIHHLLTPQESATIILSHISEGVILAEKYALPQKFIEIIRQHHGTSIVSCFYHAQLALVQNDLAKIDIDKFRYRGPKPHSKEAGVIMIADIVEATFRCMDEIAENNVSDMIERLVAEKILEGQFDESQLTFAELGVIKKVMQRTLLATRHVRAKYPEKIVLTQLISQV